MIKGTITLEDITIDFEVNNGMATYVVEDAVEDVREELIAPQDAFFKALAIAVHSDGMPNYEKDYPDAESIMHKIRWIP